MAHPTPLLQASARPAAYHEATRDMSLRLHMCHPLQLVISRNLLWPLLPPCSEIETERASARVGAFARKGKINPFHRVQALSKLCFWLAGPSFSSEVWSSPFARGASFPPSSPGFPVCCPRSSLLLAFAGLSFSSQLGLSLFRWLPPPTHRFRRCSSTEFAFLRETKEQPIGGGSNM